MKHLTLLFCFLATGALAQERAAHIFLGMPLGTLGERGAGLKPKPGFAIGLDYWFFNAKGNAWSLGASYSSFKRKNESQKETFEYLTVRAMPLVWHLDEKKQWYIEAGGFANHLLHQESQMGGSVTNNTKLFKKIYVGLSGGLGARLGEKDKTRILAGIRNDLGLLGFGKGLPLSFNIITLYAGLEI
ncbi:MAG: hypothetical protein ACKVUS_00340 [Saprospiraceae bacterium]